mgnify:CR=1 FL=1
MTFWLFQLFLKHYWIFNSYLLFNRRIFRILAICQYHICALVIFLQLTISRQLDCKNPRNKTNTNVIQN